MNRIIPRIINNKEPIINNEIDINNNICVYILFL